MTMPAPHGVYLKTNGEEYTNTAIKIVEIFHKNTPIVGPVSIDEAYLDISNMQKNFENEVQLAKMLKQKIVDSLELTCTVGIAWNRIMAKFASVLQKPDGLTVLHK